MTEEMEPEATIIDDPDESADIKENKGMAILAYIIFFIPLLAAKDSKFAMYHANQGLLLFLSWLVVSIVGTIIPVIGWLLILPLGSLFLIVLLILGIINAANGTKKPLPIIGKYKLLK
ncbi:hypothetical protein LG329_18035 [Virgibacillus necropolis]|uniref:DUF4870 domain-containing protein n=1 Tax=Virgibacillus necropolis TaxID=163877 RepID=UPI00384DF1E6